MRAVVPAHLCSILNYGEKEIFISNKNFDFLIENKEDTLDIDTLVLFLINVSTIDYYDLN